MPLRDLVTCECNPVDCTSRDMICAGDPMPVPDDVCPPLATLLRGDPANAVGDITRFIREAD